MIARVTRVQTPDGQVHLLTDLWSPDGNDYQCHNGHKVHRVRYTFVNLTTNESWTTYDHTTFSVLQEAVP